MVLMRWIAGALTLALVSGCASCAAAVGPAEPVRVAFDNPLNLIVLEARIRDQGPFRFILDSGASATVVDTELAERLGLDTAPSTTGRGTAAGSQVTFAPVRGGVDFVLAPGFEVHVGQVLAAPFTQASRIMVGEQLDGILGSAIFHRHVVEVEYEKRSLVFHDSGRFRYEGEGAVLELDFPQRMPKLPFIRATLVNGDRRLLDFPILVDSGGQTMGMASVAKRSEWDSLITPDNRVFDGLGATGLSNTAEGTTHEAFVTRMDRLILGPFEFEDPLVAYSAGGPGIAVMGASLLHRFTAVFDYSRSRLILRPNGDFDKPRMIDHSGAFLAMSDAGDGSFQVLFVADGTPAREAGLVRGDAIRSVDGVPAREIRLNEARALLCRPEKYRLAVARDGRELEVVLETRSLFDD